jgi:hypothetical protein
MRLRRVTDRRTAAATALLLAASLMSGCSFSWDSSGIKDVLLGGKKPADIVKPEEKPKSSTDADAVGAGKVQDETFGGESSLRKIAILPVAYSDGTTAGQPCDLCPPSIAMKTTSRLAARLATGFIYEAIARHPRFLFPTAETVEKTMQASPGRSMRQAALNLANAGRADLVVVAALVELRPRIGPDDGPTQPAGVTLYASLVNGRTGEVVWSDTFDHDQSGRNFILSAYDKVANDKPLRWSTAEGYSEHAVDELVEDLVDEVD